MAPSLKPFDRISLAGVLSLVTFVLGATWTAHVFTQRLAQQEQQLAKQLRDAAEVYRGILQRRLIPYTGSMHNTAAFMSASVSTTRAEFARYVARSRLLERLIGISAIGYLPKVPAGEVAQFEAEANRLFPGYRIKQPRPGAPYYFPLLYSHVTDGLSDQHLRGLDFSSIPERLSAMEIAAITDRPSATRVHMSLMDNKTPVVVTVAPIRQHDGPQALGIGEVDGFVYSVMRLDSVLKEVGGRGMGRLFGVELYGSPASPGSLLYDSDGTRSAFSRQADPYLQKTEVEFADQKWTMYLFPNPAYLEARKAGQENWMVAAIGLLLSFLAAAAVSMTARYVAARRAESEVVTRFDSFFGDHPFAVYTLDAQRRFANVNNKGAQELRLPREAIIGQPVERFVPEETHAAMLQQFERAMSGRATAYVQLVNDSTGNQSQFSVLLIPIRAGTRVVQVLGIAENITERRRAEQELAASRQMLQFILDNVPQLIFWKDTQCAFLGGNRKLLDEAGLSSIGELAGKTDFDFAWKDHAARFQADDKEIMESGLPRLNFQEPIQQEDGVHWLQTSKVPLKDANGQVIGILGVSEDITERKQLEEELVRRANYDSLTGLPNRAYFYSELERAIKRARRRKRDLALMYFDIDHFKQINDTRGHGIGDAVIREFAARVRSVLRDADMLARLGGDEFVLIVEELADRSDALALARKLVEAVRAPLLVDGTPIRVTTSLGIAFFAPPMNPDQLVSEADAAMYEAKQAGRDCYRIAPLPAS